MPGSVNFAAKSLIPRGPLEGPRNLTIWRAFCQSPELWNHGLSKLEFGPDAISIILVQIIGRHYASNIGQFKKRIFNI